MPRNSFLNRAIAGLLAVLPLTGCGDDSEVVSAIKSPDGDIALKVVKSDLGACCASRIGISGSVFGGQTEPLAEIKGSSDVRYEWRDRDTLSIVACNATETNFRSGLLNEDYTRRFILSVENERPGEDSDRVQCSSERFRRMLEL